MDRRRFLGLGAGAVATAAAGAGLVEARVLPGRDAIHRRLGACGDGLDAPTLQLGARVDDAFPSHAMRTTVRCSVLFPPGGTAREPLPVCITLHGRGGDHAWAVDSVHLPAFLAAATAAVPSTRFAMVTVDGGDAVNWHRRVDGTDPLAMIVDELLPRLAATGLRTDRIGLLGWSLGGAGALLLASRAGPTAVAAVVASSPAIWPSFEATGDGTYDDAADFAAHRVDHLADRLRAIPLWVDCGATDPFAPAVERFRATLTPPADGGVAAGCHDSLFWTRQLPGQLAFIARHLAL